MPRNDFFLKLGNVSRLVGRGGESSTRERRIEKQAMLTLLVGSAALVSNGGGRQWVVGLNKYSHDAGACLLSTDGRQSIIVPNERLMRTKHAGGDTAAAVRHALNAVGASLDDVAAVCANNHHHRVAAFEARLPWSVPMGLYASSALSAENLLPGVPQYELSHHLAHAWSAITQAPFERGLVVVMDGMGETYAAMQEGLDAGDDAYMHDLRLPRASSSLVVPASDAFGAPPGHREAESAYTFDGVELSRAFKRWVPQRSPSELYNHGFENLESLGALYSRVSSHIFGDWNACGKVMGLAPWADEWAVGDEAERLLSTPLVRGRLDGRGEDALALQWSWIEALQHPNGFGALQKAAGASIMADGQGRGADDAAARLSVEQRAQRASYVALAQRVQVDLEETTLDWLRRLREQTGETNLCFVGGVAQNSVLNGRIAREAGFEQVFIPPYPGDEGIAAGCAAYAQQKLLPKLGIPAPAARRAPWTAYQGRECGPAELASALEDFSPWVVEVRVEEQVVVEEVAGPAAPPDAADEALVDEADVGAYRELEAELEAMLVAEERKEHKEEHEEQQVQESGERSEQQGRQGRQSGEEAAWDAPSSAVMQYAAAALSRGEILGWVHGRAEVGARALGHRSILANPALREMHSKVNTVKQREQWRPLAPSVLADHAEQWFEGLPPGGSPYMQITAQVREEAQGRVPAITHVDGSARLQTVTPEDSPIYYALIAAFMALAGIPMVMNTSFNLNRMPIVESPRDALACFLEADEALSLLILHGRVLRRRPFPEGDALHTAVPTQQRSFVSRCMASSSGEALRAEILVEDEWMELQDSLELEVLERCAAPTADATASALAAEVAVESEGAVTEADVIDRLRSLYSRRLISMSA